MDVDYFSTLEGIWLERYYRLLRIYREKTLPYKFRTRRRYTDKQAVEFALRDVKKWKETGDI